MTFNSTNTCIYYDIKFYDILTIKYFGVLCNMRKNDQDNILNLIQTNISLYYECCSHYVIFHECSRCNARVCLLVYLYYKKAKEIKIVSHPDIFYLPKL
jgi:hypothetical protein